MALHSVRVFTAGVVFLCSAVFVQEAAAVSVAGVEPIIQITGVDWPGHTDTFGVTNFTENFDVLATDLGITWHHSGSEYMTAFGDTYGSPWTPPLPGDDSENWRCNFLAKSNEFEASLSNGLHFSEIISFTPPFGPAKYILACGKDDRRIAPNPLYLGSELTVIPTAGVSVNGTAYIHYMSVNHWANGGVWFTNYSGIAASPDNGQNWSKDPNTRWYNFEPSLWTNKFQQAAFAKSGGYVYMFGTQNGRFGNAYLARVNQNSMLSKSSYEYWIGGTTFVAGENNAVTIIPGPVGEMSVHWAGAPWNQWVMVYLNEHYYPPGRQPTRGAIVLRSAANLWGPWSNERVVLSSSAAYPDLYGGFVDPRSTGSNLYFTMSLFGPYNVFWMRATLQGDINGPDTGGCYTNTPYTRCPDCLKTGPTIQASWPKAWFQIRFKCCNIDAWGNWQQVGENTSYTAPPAVVGGIHAYEVDVLALTADGANAAWYPWVRNANNNGGQTASWAAAKYSANLTHADWFMNACNDGTGAQVPNCTDSRGYSTSTTATFSGLPANEEYTLYVDLKDSANTGTPRPFRIIKDLTTGDCISPPTATPTRTPTATPTPAVVISSDCSAPVILRPLANSGVPTWDSQFPTSGAHWDKVDEAASDGDGTYISSTVDGRWDEFTHASLNLTVPGSTITRVTVHATARYFTAGTNNIVGPALRVNGVGYWADKTITGAYSTVFGIWNTNPNTGQAWTVADVNSALIAVRKSYAGANVRVTQLWAEVTCAPPPPTSCAAPIILRPTGNGPLTNWDTQFPNSGLHWQKVSEVSADADTTYLSSTVDARWDDFAHTPLNIAPTATINSVTVYARARWTTSSTNNMVAPALRSGTSLVWADKTITNAYGDVFGVWNTNPATGQAWTQATVNAAYLAVRKSYQGADVRVTQVWAEVRCTGP